MVVGKCEGCGCNRVLHLYDPPGVHKMLCAACLTITRCVDSDRQQKAAERDDKRPAAKRV
jgi:hypothetical protein